MRKGSRVRRGGCAHWGRGWGDGIRWRGRNRRSAAARARVPPLGAPRRGTDEQARSDAARRGRRSRAPRFGIVRETRPLRGLGSVWRKPKALSAGAENVFRPAFIGGGRKIGISCHEKIGIRVLQNPPCGVGRQMLYYVLVFRAREGRVAVAVRKRTTIPVCPDRGAKAD